MSNYWRRRETAHLVKMLKDEEKYKREIEKTYRRMLDGAQKEIDAFYGRYADKEGISITEARKRVSEADIKAFERKAERYVRDKTFTKEANEEMRLYNATMKINRLEMLKANIGLELIQGGFHLEQFMSEILQGRTIEELERQAGILGKTIRDNKKLAHAIVNQSWHNATFSQRIWFNMGQMRGDIGKLLENGMIQGKNSRVLAKELYQYYIGNPTLKNGKSGAVYAAERLMRTELARVQTEAQKQSFEQNGFTQYTFITNGGCCAICEGISGKHFKVEKMMPGENAPPMHPFCRCSTAAYEPTTDYENWLKYLESGGTTEKWNKMTAKEKKEAVKNKKQVEKPAKNDTIKAKKKSEVRKQLENLKIKYNEVAPMKKKLSTTDIIERLGGGDKTTGSCASVGLAYIGNKLGFNVLDFRGGASMKFFSSKANKYQLLDLPGVKGIKTTVKREAAEVAKILEGLEHGKEYYLSTGRHAAVVRNTENGVEYLELQSPWGNGWKSCNSSFGSTANALYCRFGCRKTAQKIMGQTLEKTVMLLDVDSFDGNEEFIKILGYLNTAETEQKKGAAGNVK